MSEQINELTNCSSTNSFFKQLPSNCHLNISCLHVNIRSMIKNFTKLQQVVHNCTFPVDIIVVTEAGISNRIVNLYNLTGYNMYPQLRSNKRGGGIIVYIKNHLKLTLLHRQTKTFENITGIVKLNSNQDIVLCAVYRPPKTNRYIFVKELSKCMSTFNEKRNLILIGDTNIDLKTASSLTDSYLEMLSGYGLMCGISDYTRIEKKLNLITKSCIDHIFARLPTFDPYAAALDITLADHRAIMLACMGDPVSVDTREVFKQVIDYDILYKELKNVKWLQTNCTKSPVDIFNFIKRSFQNAKKAATSIIKHKFNKHKTTNQYKLPWIDDNVNQLCEKRDKLFRAWKRNPLDSKLRLEYNTIRNKVHKVLENKRNRYYIKNIQQNFNNTRKVYQIINKMLGRVTSSVDEVVLKAFEGQSIKEIVNNFAKGFDKAVKNIIPTCNVNLLSPSKYSRPNNSSLYFQKATRDKVNKIIKKLCSRKAPGSDNIGVSDIKCMNTEGATAIANLINASVETGIYPDELKIGCVRPIHKKGRRDDFLNYRPVTLLSSIDKIVEKYVCEQIYEFYDMHDVIYQNQYGFQAGKGTNDLLMKLTDEINEYLNNKKHVVVLFIDFSRAFDTLDHKQIITKLDDCGIRGPLLRWCANYLKNRKFSVRINDTYSDPVTVTEDDTCLLVADEDPDIACDMLQSDFNMLAKWCHDAGLVLNSIKTKLLHIKSPYIKRTLSKRIIAHNHDCLHSSCRNTNCSCPSIELVNTQTYLGMQIDNKFTWHNHIEYVCNKLRQFLANIIILKNRIPFPVKMMLYNSLAESYIQYGLGSYGRTFITYLNKIYNLQIRILKNIVTDKIRRQFHDDDSMLFKHCNILPVHTQVKYLLLKNTFLMKIYNLKSSTPGANNMYGERTAGYIVPRLINNLPSELRVNLNTKNIKQKLKMYFLDTL
ncbi:hypothetical protein ABMA27_004866 [Loxostege sticticalis]|uniref:Reverse transcriptase domain-containing protein n=1 Tax=Loxostege sticticalis TaxID=481309 RepID=A0ABR3HL89_LOXSC